MITTNVNSSKGSLNDDQTSNDSHSRDNSTSYFQEDDDESMTFRSRKSYPQRSNRPKLNYRDLERGVYDAYEIRQSTWALGGPDRNKISKNTDYSDEDDEDEDINPDDENTKSNDDTDQLHRSLWCICKKPWDCTRLMLRCDSCANWYHGDCIGVTKEQARVLEMNGDQFVCPPCQGVTGNSVGKSGRSSDESALIKRKRIDEKNGSMTTSKHLTQSEPSKRPKAGIFFQRESSSSAAEPQIHCIVHGCSNWAKPGWVYCSPACIRRHINETIQAIQRSKGANNDNLPTREDILLYENRTKKILDRKFVPKVEDLCTWINQHPSYEIVKPALRQSILLTANESKPSTSTNFTRSPSIVASTTPKTPTTPTSSSKPKLSWAPVTPNTKSVPIKKAPVQLGRQTSHTPSSPGVQNYADIRMKVPQALYDKLLMRLEKSGEKNVSNDEIKIIVEKIEEEMYRVYGKVDNSYKNKFRSLLANISNINNNFFYKHILSKETTAKHIVAMKPEDMLPPEEKEKRKDEFEKEVQMIMKANEETAEEMARRARTKNTRQGLVDNDAVVQQTNEASLAAPIIPETNQSKSKIENKPTSTKPIVKTKKPMTTNIVQKPKQKIEPSIPEPTPPPPPPPPSPPALPKEPVVSLPPKPIDQSPKREESTPVYPTLDLDNDYIEPESPTGIDALLYDDDDDFNNIHIQSRPSNLSQQSSHPESPGDNHDYLPSAQQTVRDDYNPLTASKSKTDLPSTHQTTVISRSVSIPTQWRGVILPPDTKLLCQSVHIYGESDYLVSDIPEQLGILGRLRLGDLWDYVRDSLPVRDVVILTITSSTPDDNNAFSRYVDALRTSGRAAVINKRTDPSLIRDMYVMPADTKDCPANVISNLALATNLDPKQLFLVVIGSGKRTNRTSNRTNENQATNQFTYKPVSLQDTTVKRDPRLVKNKDPRLAGNNSTETISVPNTTKTIPNQLSTDDLVKLMSESMERIRQTPSADIKQSLVMSTLEFLKSNNREDLSKQFAQDVANEMSTNTAVTVEDNLNEENMEVEEEQDDKYRKQLELNEFNDVDYRLFDQDMDHRMGE